ncbi:MAG: TetR/AcrR family transcriptional regulator [Acidimicrobiales bacterium]|jgi:AcrR family transcriptional regulator
MGTEAAADLASTREADTKSAPTRGADTKRRIVDAAEEVVLRDGVARLTLDAAAAEAGLSKGGILYHFPTRDALVAGMVGKIIEEFDRDIEQNLGDAPGPGQFARAYIRATMTPSSTRPDREDRLGAAVIAAAAAEPALLEPLQVAADRWQSRLENDGLEPALATLLRLACDGLWLCDLFGLAPPSAALRTGIELELARLAADWS